MRVPKWRSAMLVLAAALIGACSGVKTYPEQAHNNVRIHTFVDSGSSFSSTVAEFDIHKMVSRCEIEYEGRVYLDQPVVETGIPVGQKTYLDFIFASKAMLSSNISATRYKTVFTPRAGYTYDIRVSYNKGIYSVVMREVARGSSAGRTLERRDPPRCQ
jgi:hypothetical protein